MSSRVSETHRLYPPAPLDEAAVHAALQAVAGVSGQPRVVLEVSGQAGRTQWRLSAERWALTRLLRALGDQLPGLRHEPAVQPLPQIEHAARVRFRGDARLPLGDRVTPTVIRGLLGALAGTRRHERLTLQLILGPRRRPGGLPPEPRRDRRAVEAKQRQYRVGCEIRLGATASDEARARSLIEAAAGSLRALDVPGLSLQLSRTSVAAMRRADSPLLWGNHLAISDLVPLTGYPIGELPLPGVPDPHPVRLPAAAALPRTGRLLGVSSLNAQRPIALRPDDSLRHLHLLGPTGVGKSTLLAQLALSDMAAGHGVVVIDPKGDLVDELLARVPDERRDDVVVLDARSDAPVGLNGLASPADPDLAADTLLAVFHSLYAESWGPRTQDILHACLLTLARRGDGSLALIPLLLSNPGFRRSTIGRVVAADPLGLGAFWGWYEALSDAERSQAIAPLMNKLRPILLRPGMRGIFGQRQPRVSLRQVLSERKILLVDLGKGHIGSEAAQLLGSMVVAMLWAEALRRAGTSAARTRPVMVHIDEVQDYLRLPGDLGDALAQARGLGVGFTLAHQHLGQLPSGLREAVLANARSRIAFALTGRDARDIAGLSRGQVSADDLAALPAFEAYAALHVRGSAGPWASLRTVPLGERRHRPEQLRRAAARRYGRPLTEVEADLLALADGPRADRGSERLGRVQRDQDGSAP